MASVDTAASAAPALSPKILKSLAEVKSCESFVVSALKKMKVTDELMGKVATAFEDYVAQVKSGKKRRLSKGESGEDKPKKQPNAYNLFAAETIKKLRAEDPSMTQVEAMVKAGALWKEHKAKLEAQPQDTKTSEPSEVVAESKPTAKSAKKDKA